MKQLIVYVGPVRSEKSTHALRAAARHQRLGRKAVLIRPLQSIRPDPADPTRGDRRGVLVTKNGEEYPSLDSSHARDIVAAAGNADVVWLDEPQLWPDEAEHVFDAVARLRARATVIVSGLAATSELEPFGVSMPKLLAVADIIKMCKADCDECAAFGIASRSRYIGEEAKEGQVKVGGEPDYAANCPTCWSALTST